MPDSPWSIANVIVAPPKRGPGTQENFEFYAQSLSLTWSWGANPATGEITFVAPEDSPTVIAGASLEIELFGKTFYGVCQSGPVIDTGSRVIPSVQASSGKHVSLHFEDTRTYLKWDQIFGAFNMADVRIINGRRLKRYWHIFPRHFRRWQKTWTTAPLTAATILDAVFSADTMGTEWQRVYHPDQVRLPVYGIDALSGKRLDEIVQEISDAQGLLFTVMGGPFRLLWVRKGEGLTPAFPARSDNRRLGTTISGHPTRLFVVGDRNLYQVLDVPLLPDWNRAWEQVFDLDLLADDLFNHETDPVTRERYNAIPGDTGQARGWQLAQARAREISVGQYAALRLARDRVDFRDWRRSAGRSRMDMPAALYIQTLLFRAFRPPATINLGGHEVPTAAVDLSEEAVAKVTHDIRTGKMSASLEEVSGNGYAIARGYRIGQELFQAIRPERFNLDDFLDSVNLWSPMSFQLDDSGEDGRFLLFDEPVIRTSNLLSIVNGYAVLNANPVFEIPEVRAALTFEGDKFFYAYGSGSRDDSAVVPGLRAEYVVNGGRLTEVPYADGKLAAQKADEIARTLAARPYLYAQGGYEFELLDNDTIPDLAGTIDRITLECSSAGRVCRLEFTNERPIRVYQPERDLDRRVRQQSLLPGQQELRQQARTMRLIAGAFKQSPGLVRWLHQLFKTRLGSNDSTYPILIANGTGRLSVGTPLWKEPYPAQTRAVMPQSVMTAHLEFAGVTVRENENAAKPIRVQKTGQLLARVRGPIAFGDSVVRVSGADYLVKKSGESGAPAVGTAEQAIAEESVQLIPVLSGGGGGSGGGGEGKRRAVWG